MRAEGNTESRAGLTRLIQGKYEGNSRLGRNTEIKAGLTNMMQGRCGGKNGLRRSAETQERNTEQTENQNPENTILKIPPSIHLTVQECTNTNPSTQHHKLTKNARKSFKPTTLI